MPTSLISALQILSEQPNTHYPHGVTHASTTTLGFPRWNPIAHSQQMPLHAVSVSVQQASMAMITTVTTTATTASATTSTSTSTNVITDGTVVPVNYRLGNVVAIWEEYQVFEQERQKEQKTGKNSLGILRKHQKQLNNKKGVIEEIEYRVNQIIEGDDSINRQNAIQRAIAELNTLFKLHLWTVNQLVNYYRDQK
ncbi:hypothetical protein FBU30_005219 [Linnemannia zychae]|nr:hypothetical protein FBU30_005219 [Linnemannia zychae]